MAAGGHLAALHLADPAFGMQHEDVDIGKSAQRRDRRRTGIARGRRHDGGLAAAALERAGEQPPQNLQRDILEGEGGAVKQLQQIAVAAHGRQRRDVRMLEPGIGGFDVFLQFGGGETVADKARQDFERHILVALAFEARDLGRD